MQVLLHNRINHGSRYHAVKLHLSLFTVRQCIEHVYIYTCDLVLIIFRSVYMENQVSNPLLTPPSATVCHSLSNVLPQLSLFYHTAFHWNTPGSIYPSFSRIGCFLKSGYDVYIHDTSVVHFKTLIIIKIQACM